MRAWRIFKFVVFLMLAASFSLNVFAGKLYIKPELERKRADRLLDEAESDFRNAKIHLTFSPEISLTEFTLAKEKFKQAVEIIEQYGAGYYTPGDVDDFQNRIKECDIWITNAMKKVREAEQSASK